jgi:group I intron endonuclease
MVNLHYGLFDITAISFALMLLACTVLLPFYVSLTLLFTPKLSQVVPSVFSVTIYRPTFAFVGMPLSYNWLLYPILLLFFFLFKSSPTLALEESFHVIVYLLDILVLFAMLIGFMYNVLYTLVSSLANLELECKLEAAEETSDSTLSQSSVSSTIAYPTVTNSYSLVCKPDAAEETSNSSLSQSCIYTNIAFATVTNSYLLGLRHMSTNSPAPEATFNEKPTHNRNILAKCMLESNNIITAAHLEILHPHRPKLDQATLNTMISFDKHTFDLPLTLKDSLRLTDVAGRPNTNVHGVYKFIAKNTGKVLYVGSSSNLAKRIRQYLNPSSQDKASGLIKDYVKHEGNLANTLLEVYPLPEPHNKFYVQLEQYYILTHDPDLNVLKLANGAIKSLDEKTVLMQIIDRGIVTYAYHLHKKVLISRHLSVRQAALAYNLGVNSITWALKNHKEIKGLFFSHTSPDKFNYVLALSKIAELKLERKAKGDTLKSLAAQKVCVKIYVYNDTKDTLLHVFNSVTNAIKCMGGNTSALYKALKTNSNYKNIYPSYTLLDGTLEGLLPTDNMANYLDKHIRGSGKVTYFLRHEVSGVVVKLSSFAQVELVFKKLGLDSTLIRDVTSRLPNRASKSINGFFIELDQPSLPLGDLLYPNSILFNKSYHHSTASILELFSKIN